ncbi:MAG: hydrogenase nickel incorporation protein HypB [Sciscionella sp.]
MCATCGCSEDGAAVITDVDQVHEHAHGSEDGHGHGHDHDHAGAHGHDHGAQGTGLDHDGASTTTVSLEQKVLRHNDELATRAREWLRGRAVLAVNLMSSPGSGKTTLLEHTARALSPRMAISVIEGDQETLFDAERIRGAGCRAVQINTGSGCHLDAEMVTSALHTVDPPNGSLVFIENVGNLVCPALFDLGENRRVVIMSVTEGEDKPLKYPHMFRAADLLLLNKIDLLPYLDFDVQRCLGFAHRVNPDIEVLKISATSGEGLEDWYSWLGALQPSPS